VLRPSPGKRARRAPSCRRSARAHAALLGPCYKTGRAQARAARASRRLFRAFSLRSRASFLLSLAVLLRYRSVLVFSLRWFAPPVHRAVPRTATLPETGRRTGLAPSSARLSRLFRLPGPRAHSGRFAAGAFPFARCYSGNPCSFFLLRVVICLSSAGVLTRVVRSAAGTPVSARRFALSAAFLACTA